MDNKTSLGTKVIVFVAACSILFVPVLGQLEARQDQDTQPLYAPSSVPCPSPLPTIRPALDGLSPQESAWLQVRGNNTFQAMIDVIDRAQIPGITARDYMNKIVVNGGKLPRLAIAVSGGGYRALMNGAGALAAFDNRTAGATGTGQLGGILQAATYLSGLSGGSWLVGSLYIQNFATVESIVEVTDGMLSKIWQFNETILEGPADLRVGEYYRQLNDAVDAKGSAGYNTSITDFWGRALSYQLFNAGDGDPGTVFSSIANDDFFKQGQSPLPIVVAVERTTGQIQIAQNSTVMEFNPWEMGSYDALNPAWAPLQFVGSDFNNGKVSKSDQCIAGVDNVGFVVGTSSSLFNQAFLQIGKVEGVPDFLIRLINNTLANIGSENRDVAIWPNPFFNYNKVSNLNAEARTLTLVDGGEDLQNIPLHPLTWQPREVDLIIAVDSSADTKTLWPNGTALVATYQRSVSGINVASAGFPSIPDQNTFINLGLNSRPTIFGCNATDTSPLVLYLPNAPYSFLSNVSTFDLEYTTEERDSIIQNGYNVATMGNSTVHVAGSTVSWPACVSCAMLWRSFAGTKTEVPTVCNDCFKTFCWNGTVDSKTPGTYEPAMAITKSGGGRGIEMSWVMGLVVVFWAVYVI